MLSLLLFLLPLGLDTLGVSISLGMKAVHTSQSNRAHFLPPWLLSALLFALAEMIMPLVGLAIGYAASLLMSEIMRFVGPILLIGIGLWELSGEVREVLEKSKKKPASSASSTTASSPPSSPSPAASTWIRQLLLALTISLDELAVGFSFGAIATRIGGTLSPLIICLLLGLQGFLMTIIGLTLGRVLRTSVRPLKQWCEWLSALLLIGLGTWLLMLGD